MTKAENTKQFIVEKTAKIFNKKGYVGTSFNDLMSATNLSKGCIYGHFENKDEIALAAFDFNRGKMQAYITKQMEEKDKSIDKLLVYPHVIRQFLSIPEWEGGCPILNTSIEADDTHDPLRKKAAEALDSWQNKISKLIKEGINKGEIKPNTDVKEIAILIVYMIESSIMQAKVSGTLTSLNVAMGYLEKTIENLKR